MFSENCPALFFNPKHFFSNDRPKICSSHSNTVQARNKTAISSDGFSHHMKSFLENNKIYFETVVGVLLSVAALVLIVQGNRVADKSLEVSRQQLSLYEKELELNELQTAIARASIKPRFLFNAGRMYGNSEIPHITVSYSGAPIHKLRGECIAYLILHADGHVKNVELENFYYQAHGGTTEHGELNFFTYPKLKDLALFRFMAPSLSALTSNPRARVQPWPLRIRSVFTITYFDSTGVQQKEVYDAEWPAESVEPLQAAPTMDERIDVRDFYDNSTRDIRSREFIPQIEKLVSDFLSQPGE